MEFYAAKAPILLVGRDGVDEDEASNQWTHAIGINHNEAAKDYAQHWVTAASIDLPATVCIAVRTCTSTDILYFDVDVADVVQRHREYRATAVKAPAT